MKFAISALLLAFAATASSATSLRAVGRNLPGSNDQKRGRNDVGRGSPSYLEFVKGGCIGFDTKKEGQKAKVVSCSGAPEFVRRDDDLLELENTDWCLEADDDDIYLRECDNDYDEQKWLFTRTVNKKKRVYRMFNYDTHDFVEKVNNKVTLQSKDQHDEDQLLKEFDDGFFETD